MSARLHQVKAAPGPAGTRSEPLQQSSERPEPFRDGLGLQGASLASRKGIGKQDAVAPQIVHEALRSPGQPLDAATRAYMEPRFRHDFSRVRVHTDAKAAASASAMKAFAYAVGRDVVCASGRYAPSTREGRHLLTHELAHVVQDGGVRDLTPPGPIRIAADNDPLEAEARTAASHVYRAVPWKSRSRSVPSTPVLYRLGVGEAILRFFGGGTFRDAELDTYLEFLDANDRIEDDFDSDNKARAIVERWKTGDSLYVLSARRKSLLIREMLSGFTGDDDERAILDLLRGSTDADVASIAAAVGVSRLQDDFHGAEREELDHFLSAKALTNGRAARVAPEQGADVFSGEVVVELQKRFRSNSESANRLNCILIIRELAPKIFEQDPELAARVTAQLSQLRGLDIKMTEFGRVLSELGLASRHLEIRFGNGNGNREPGAMEQSAWEAIVEMVGATQGWHVFGLAVFNGYHSVTVLVDNRPDGPRIYWADQWRIDPGDDFHQAPGSVSGFRRYEQEGFDTFINDKTREWWNEVHSPDSRCAERAGERGRDWDRSCRWPATLHIWKFRSRLEQRPQP